MFALIFENKVVDIVNKEFPCVKSMKWVECNDKVQIGWFYVEGIFKKSLESEEELLAQLKESKLTELENYYSSDECWKFKVQSTTLRTSITKTAEWFGRMLPASAGFSFTMKTDNGYINVGLPEEKAKRLNFEIQNKASLAISQKQLELITLINSSSKEDLEKLDVKAYLGEIPRIIEIDNI